MVNSNRTREFEFYDAVEAVLVDEGGSATVTQVRRKIPKYISLTPEDRTPSVTRNGEELWEQQVRNIICHRECDDNPIKLGRFVYRNRKLYLPGVQLGLFENDNN